MLSIGKKPCDNGFADGAERGADAGRKGGGGVKDYQIVSLLLYPKLERLNEDIGKIVEAKAQASYTGKESAESCVQKILDYLYVRDCFAVLKERLDKILEGLSREEKYLLEYKYFRRTGVLQGEFADMRMDCVQRTYFRRQKRLEGKLGCLFLREGMDENWFAKAFGSVPYVAAALECVREKKVGGFVDKRTKAELRCARRRAQ